MSNDLKPFDAPTHLTEEEDREALLADAVASGDAALIAAATKIVVRARGMANLATRAEMSRQQL